MQAYLYFEQILLSIFNHQYLDKNSCEYSHGNTIGLKRPVFSNHNFKTFLSGLSNALCPYDKPTIVE